MDRYLRVLLNGKKLRSFGYDPRDLGIYTYISGVKQHMIIRYSWGREVISQYSMYQGDKKIEGYVAFLGIPTLDDFEESIELSLLALLGHRLEFSEDYEVELVFVKKTSKVKKKYVEGYVKIRKQANSYTMEALRFNPRTKEFSVSINSSTRQGDEISWSTSELYGDKAIKRLRLGLPVYQRGIINTLYR